MIVAIGAYGNKLYSGHVRVFSYTLSTNTWDLLGLPIVGAAEGDWFGESVSLSSNGMIVAIEAEYNNDNGSDSGYVRVFSYTLSTNTWDLLGSPIVGASTGYNFGASVSLSSNGMIVAIRYTGNDDNGSSGHTRVFPPAILF